MGILVVYDILRTVKSLIASKSWIQNTDFVLNAQVEDIANRIGTKVPRILLQKNNQSPFVFGLLKASIVFPENFSEVVNPETLSSVIAHELAHIKDYDTRWNLLEHLTRRFFFFHPLVYSARNLYTDAQEKSADLQAIRSLNIKKSDFAKSFFEVISFCKESNSYALSASSTSSFKSLKSRINYLANSGQESSKSSTMLLFAVGFLFSGAWSFVEARSSLGNSTKNEMGINMCVQVQHEIALEKLFLVKSVEPLRCE